MTARGRDGLGCGMRCSHPVVIFRDFPNCRARPPCWARPQVAETGGDMQQYWQLWRSGRWWWHVNPHNITEGGDHHSVCAF